MKKAYGGQGDWQVMEERAKRGRIGRRRVSWEVFCFSHPTQSLVWWYVTGAWVTLDLGLWDCGGCLCYFYNEACALGGY